MMTEQEIISKVKAILNEIGEEETLSLLSEDTVKIEEYIKVVIPDAVSLVQMNSPVRCVNKKNGVSSDATVISDSEGKCLIPVPDDFVSLIAIKLSNWKRTCIVAFDLNSEEYKQQCNSYTRVGSYKPVCIMGYNNSGNRVLMLYSAKSDSKLEMFVYEAKYTLGTDLDIDQNEPVSQAICYMAASLVYSIFENKVTSQEMRNIAVSLIPQK